MEQVARPFVLKYAALPGSVESMEIYACRHKQHCSSLRAFPTARRTHARRADWHVLSRLLVTRLHRCTAAREARLGRSAASNGGRSSTHTHDMTDHVTNATPATPRAGAVSGTTHQAHSTPDHGVPR